MAHTHPTRIFPHALLASALAAAWLAGCTSLTAPPALAPDPVGTTLARGKSTTEAAPSAAAPGEASPAPAVKPPDVAFTPRMLFGIISAEIGLQRGEGGYAFTEYLRLARETHDPRLARRATEIALAARAMPQALDAATAWHQIAPGDSDAEGMHASLLVATGRYDEARPLLERQIRASPEPLAVLDRLQRMLGHATEPARGLGLVESLAAPAIADPKRAFEAHVILARAARDAGDSDRAASQARAALALRPDSEPAVVSVSQALADGDGAAGKAGRTAAITLLGRWLARHEDALDARQTYARLLVGEGRVEDARRQFEDLLRRAPGRADTFYALGVLALDAERFSQARTYLGQYLAAQGTGERDPEAAWIGMARAAEGEHRLDEALDWLHKVQSPARQGEAREREAFILARQKHVEEGMKLLAQIPAEDDEGRARILIAQGQLLRDAHRFTESFDLLDHALKANPDDTALLYESAMSAERLDHVEVMETRLRRLLALQPEAAHAWNALGFTFADRNIRLDEAYQLIDRALSLAPEDGYIVDSMGWVQFRLGKLDAARESLQRAYRLKEDPDVAAHLGEVLWALGDHAGARDVLLEAHRRDDQSEALRETLERLKIQP